MYYCTTHCIVHSCACYSDIYVWFLGLINSVHAPIVISLVSRPSSPGHQVIARVGADPKSVLCGASNCS